LDYRELRNVLLSKGGTIEDRRSHHVFFFLEIDGKYYRATKFSHSAHGQISDDLLGSIARQMRLTVNELKHFVDCSVQREQWLEFWRERRRT